MGLFPFVPERALHLLQSPETIWSFDVLYERKVVLSAVNHGIIS